MCTQQPKNELKEEWFTLWLYKWLVYRGYKDFIDKMKENHGRSYKVYTDEQHLCNHSDMIYTQASEKPILKKSWLKKSGVTIIYFGV